jgi:iron complex transport system substrate-binding protein
MKNIYRIIVLLGLSVLLVSCTKGQDKLTDLEFEREDVTLSIEVTTGALENTGGNGWVEGVKETKNVTFKTNPRSVAIFSYDALDILDYVGLEKTSIQYLGLVKGSSIPTYLNQYMGNNYENVGTLFMPDWDKLELFMPDLIILGTRSSGAYDRLRTQFPSADILDLTITDGFYMEGFERNINYLKTLFPSIALEIEETYQDILIKMDTIKSLTANKNAMIVMINGSVYSTFGQISRYSVLYNQFGFTVSDQEMTTANRHGREIDHEYVYSINPEFLFLLDRGAAIGSSGAIGDFLQNNFIQQTLAYQQNHVYTLNASAWYIAFGGFHSTYQMIEDLDAFVLEFSNLS